MTLSEADRKWREERLAGSAKRVPRKGGNTRFQPNNAVVYGRWFAALTDGEARVYHVLDTLAGPDNHARVGGSKLGALAGLNRTNALRHAAALVRRGLVRVVERGHSGRGERRTANTYELLVPAPKVASEEEGEEPD